jgi:predicted amidophosphoribosyltransferase
MIFKLKSIHHALALNSRLKIIRSFMQQDCVLCNAASGAHMLCLACYAGLPRITNACPQCAAHSNGEICGACLTHPPTYDRAFAALDYTFPVDKLIQTLKYGHQLALAHLLGEISAVALRAMPRPDRILPMPLHPTRLRQSDRKEIRGGARLPSRHAHREHPIPGNAGAGRASEKR